MRFTAYRNYLLTVLLVILVFNYLDRMALGIVLQDLKTEFDLTDKQLGLLSGMAFALFYSVMGVPIARWADRGDRVAIISLSAALWSLAVALCGTAGSFVQLILIRVGVAVGEAGCVPPAFSLMADYFNRADRPRAAAIYGLGGPLSFVIGFFLAGWLNELYGWRMTFIWLGLPGLALAALAWFTLREPRCKRLAETISPTQPETIAPPVSQPSLKEVFVTLWANATFRHLLLCLSVLFFFIYGVLTWQPTFFIRSFGFTSGELGTWFAVVYGSGGFLGSYLGGALASRYAAYDERLQLVGLAVTIAAAGVLSTFIYLSPNPYLAFALTGLTFLGLTTVNGPLFATIQTLVPQQMRAVSFALVYLFANLIGMGLGPLAAGALSDALRPWAGEESLRYALLILGPGYLLSAWHVWRASETVARDLAAVPADRDAVGEETGATSAG